MNHGLPPPQFSVDSGYFVVTFQGQPAKTGAAIAPELLGRLDKRQRQIIDLVRERGSITPAELVSVLKISRATATRQLAKLVELGALQARGKGRATRHVLVGS